MKTLVYGGSFNPPHLGHVAAAEFVAGAVEPDRFLIIPASIPPHKDLAEGSPAPEERLELCRLAFGHIPGAEISDMELQREGRSYTADTIDALKEQWPEDEFFLVVGSDMFLSFRQWYRYQYLLDNVTLTVISREDDDRRELAAFARELEEECGARIEILDHEPMPMCSEDIRARLRLGLGSDMLPQAVYAQIIRCRYYEAQPELTWLRAQVAPRLSGRRMAHSAGCEQEAVQLARSWGEDPEKAAVVGILHDVTKDLSFEEQLTLCREYGILLEESDKAQPQLLHAVTGAAVAEREFGVSQEMAQAIRWHTTGKPDMTTLEKILYLADYIEPTRDFEGLDELRELCYRDLDQGLALGLKMSLEHLKEKGVVPDRHSVDALEWYTNRE